MTLGIAVEALGGLALFLLAMLLSTEGALLANRYLQEAAELAEDALEAQEGPR